MKTNIYNLIQLCLLTGLICLTGSCKKAPEGFSADFNISHKNGGMVTDTVELSARFDDADSYEWIIQGLPPRSGQNVAVVFQTAGSFSAQLTVKSGKHSKTNSEGLTLNNFPSGTALTVVQGNGEVGTAGIDGSDPFWLSFDNAGASGGMDYDDDTGQLYYSGSIKRAFPNGVDREIIYTEEAWEEITALAVDSDDKRVYFDRLSDGYYSIFSIDTEGTEIPTQEAFFMDGWLRDLTLDAANDRVYFTNGMYDTTWHLLHHPGRRGHHIPGQSFCSKICSGL